MAKNSPFRDLCIFSTRKIQIDLFNIDIYIYLCIYIHTYTYIHKDAFQSYYFLGDYKIILYISCS